jgi:hypothetical protein
MVARQTQDQEQATYQEMLVLARRRNWIVIQQMLGEFEGRVTLDVGEPSLPGKKDLTRREQRIWEAVLVLVAAECGLLITRNDYSDELVVTRLAPTEPYDDPFRDQ